FLNDVGINEAWEFARKLGITTITEADNAAQTGVIGGLTVGTSVKELTGAFSSIPNKGVFRAPYIIQKLVDAEGKTVYEHEAIPKPVYSEQTAYIMTDMLKTVVTAGTATDLMSKFKHYKSIEIA